MHVRCEDLIRVFSVIVKSTKCHITLPALFNRKASGTADFHDLTISAEISMNETTNSVTMYNIFTYVVFRLVCAVVFLLFRLFKKYESL
jgi:hypothetical protein